MDEDGWNGLSADFTNDLNHEFQSTSDDFFEQVNQINFCLSKKEMKDEDEEQCTYPGMHTNSLFSSTFNSLKNQRLPQIKTEVMDEDDDPDDSEPYDIVNHSSLKRSRLEDFPNPEIDLYKFDDFSSGSDCGSCSPSDFGPCASSTGSSSKITRPSSLPLSFCKLEDEEPPSPDNVTFIGDTEPDIPSPTPPANDSNPVSCAAMLERMGNINDAPLAAPRCSGVRGPRTSLQTMTGSGGYTPLDNAYDTPDGRRPMSQMRSLTNPLRHFHNGRPRSLHSRKTPHYTSRLHPSIGMHHRSSPSLHMRPSDLRSSKFEDEENPPRLWKFLFDLLEGKRLPHKLVEWTDRSTLTFRLVDSKEVSRLWGIKKHKPNMCYESLGRSLRYYYGKGVLEKVETQRLCYRYKRDHLMKNGIYIS